VFVAQDTTATQPVPSENLASLIGNTDWPLIRIGEVFQLLLDISKIPGWRPAVASNVAVLPAAGQDAIRLRIGAEVTISVAATFWNDDLQAGTCLRCTHPLQKCKCKLASDLLELTQPVQVVEHGKFVAISVRIPRTRKCKHNNSWLRNQQTRAGQSRLPKVGVITCTVLGAQKKATSVAKLTGCFRLLAKNGGLKPGEEDPLRPLRAKGLKKRKIIPTKVQKPWLGDHSHC
jgi:hypothetical protein